MMRSYVCVLVAAVLFSGCMAEKKSGLDPHLRVMVDGAALQPMADLEKSFDWVSTLFDGREWTYHKSCVDLAPGVRAFLIKHFHKRVSTDDAIVWGEANGYRPATHLEAIAFAKAHPNLQRQFWIVALGSSTLRGGRNRYVAVLSSGSDGRGLRGRWLDFRWDASRRFLFVRK